MQPPIVVKLKVLPQAGSRVTVKVQVKFGISADLTEDVTILGAVIVHNAEIYEFPDVKNRMKLLGLALIESGN
jgi:hypothetical protein